MFGTDRNQLRNVFFIAWQKYLRNKPMEPMDPMEQIIVDIIVDHPEYQDEMSDKDRTLDKDYLPEAGQSNPFLHMAMHITIKEQLTSKRPKGIKTIYQSLVLQSGDCHKAEHRMMECLAEIVWQIQKNGAEFDEAAYLRSLEKLMHSS